LVRQLLKRNWFQQFFFFFFDKSPFPDKTI
jgi:hypothetical protein